MNTLLLINTIVMGISGLMFGLWGSNVQSRLFGLINLFGAIANLLVLSGIISGS
jgi:hypothetical protein